MRVRLERARIGLRVRVVDLVPQEPREVYEKLLGQQGVIVYVDAEDEFPIGVRFEPGWCVEWAFKPEELEMVEETG